MSTLGVDLGGTNARAAVVNEEGKILAAVKIPLDDRRPERVVDIIARAALEATHASSSPITACGVGAAGQIRGDSGVIAVAPNLGWRDVPLGQMLHRALGRPVTLTNDLRAAAWGEFKVGAGRGARDVWTMFVGTGVGSAVIANGALVTGARGVAGEFGHVKVVPGGRRCGCGQHGCLEAYVGGAHLLEQMRELLQSGRPTLLAERVTSNGGVLTPALLEEAAEGGDQAAKEIYDAAVGHLALAVANQITVLNPARLLIGGGVLLHCHGMRQRIKEAIAKYTSETAAEQVTVTDAALGDDAGLIGAALLAS